MVAAAAVGGIPRPEGTLRGRSPANAAYESVKAAMATPSDIGSGGTGITSGAPALTPGRTTQQYQLHDSNNDVTSSANMEAMSRSTPTNNHAAWQQTET